MPSSVFRDDHDSQGVKDTVGHHYSSVDDLGNLTSRGGTPARPRRDACFYIEPVTFQVSNSLSPVTPKSFKYSSNNQVGNTLFKVPKTGLQVPGTIFEAMFSLPTNETEEIVEGSGDDNPIHLHGIDENKFRAFLTLLYPSYVADSLLNSSSRLTIIAAVKVWPLTRMKKVTIED